MTGPVQSSRTRATRLPVRRLILPLFAGILTFAGCNDPHGNPLAPGEPSFAVIDGAHSGNPHFYWLAPMVKSPTVTGTFDAGVAPQIDICQWTGSACIQPALATFTTTTGPGSETVRVDTTSSLYIVNWHTDQFALSVGATYRIAASVRGAVVGLADVQVLSNGSAKNVTTGDDIALVDGKTLPIKFRIEQGLVVAIAIAPNPDTVVLAKTSSLTATLTDAHGNVVANQPVTWTTGSAAVASVSAQGVVTGAGLGSTTVNASSNGMTGTGTVVTIRPPVASVVVTPAANSIQVGQQVALTATLKDADGNVLTGRAITWSSSDVTSATVDANGLVTGVQPSAVTITATSEGIAGAAQVTITSPGFIALPGTLTGGDLHTCAIAPDHRAYCWGLSWYGELGTASGTDEARPNPVVGGLTFSQIAAGNHTTCALTLDGAAYCWGANNAAQLGDGNFYEQEAQRAVPGPVLTSMRFTRIGLDTWSPCALDAAGYAWCWGWNSSLLLGSSQIGLQPAPVLGLGGAQYQALAQSSVVDCGLTLNGSVNCYGFQPTRVSVVGPTLTAYVVRGGTGCGLDASGAVWCSGNNQDGEFGNGTSDGNFNIDPVRAASGMIFTALTAGEASVCGLTGDGDIYCWGANGNGELGNGTTTNSYVPVRVSSSVKFTSMGHGEYHVCATAVDGGVYCWGQNNFGQLGDGTTTARSVPTRVVAP